MKYVNSDEIKRKRRKFFVLYGLTLCLVVLACTAFIKSSSTLAPQNPPVIINKDLNGSLEIKKLNDQWLNLLTVYEANQVGLSQLTPAEAETRMQSIEKVETDFKVTLDHLSADDTSGNGQLAKIVAAYKKIIIAPKPYEQPVSEASQTDNTTILTMRLKQKDQQIEQLKQRIIVANRNAQKSEAPASGAASGEETKFLKWALSSQSGELKKLQDENARLKRQLKN